MNDFPIGSRVRDKRGFADDLPYWEVTSKPERGSTCTFVWVRDPNSARRSKRNIAFLVNVTFIDNE